MTGKYPTDDSVRQPVTEASGAWVMLFEKSAVNGKIVRTQMLESDGFVDAAGITADKKEGDGKTPIGDFGTTCTFGLQPNP